MNERETLARTLWGEARGEGLGGMIAVAWVIRNRAAKPGWWGRDVSTVCLKPWQFSCWNKGDPNYPYLSGQKPIPASQYAKALQAADAVLLNKEPDPTAGATHYYAKSMKTPPKWAATAKKTVTIGNHHFFKDVQ